MVTDADRKSGEEVETEEESEIDWAWPEPKSEQASDVQHNNKKTVGPVQTRIFR